MFAALKSGATIPARPEPVAKAAPVTSGTNSFTNGGGPPRNNGGGDECKVKVYNIPEGESWS